MKIEEYGEKEPLQDSPSEKEISPAALSTKAEILRAKILAVRSVKDGKMDEEKLTELMLALHDVEIKRKIYRLKKDLADLESGADSEVYLGLPY